MQGNVVDMAIGVVIGGAFGGIVASAVNDILMPPIGLLLGGVNFNDIKIVLKEASTDAAGQAIAAVTMNIGNFIQTCINFIIVALFIFAVIKSMNAMKKKEAEALAAPAAPPAPTPSEKLLEEIRDLLKK